MNKATRGDPEVVDPAVLESSAKPSVEFGPPIDDARVAWDDHARCDRGIQRRATPGTEIPDDRANLQLADHRERKRESVPGDQQLELGVSSTPVVDEREDVGVDGERTRRHVAAIHLGELGDRGHESVALPFARIRVVERFGLDRLTCSLLAREILDRARAPILAGLEAEHELFAPLDGP